MSTQIFFTTNGFLTLDNCTIQADFLSMVLEGGAYESLGNWTKGNDLQSSLDRHSITMVRTSFLGKNKNSFFRILFNYGVGSINITNCDIYQVPLYIFCKHDLQFNDILPHKTSKLQCYTYILNQVK